MKNVKSHQILYYCGAFALHIIESEFGVEIGSGLSDSKPDEVNFALMDHETLFKLKQFIDWEVEKKRMELLTGRSRQK